MPEKIETVLEFKNHTKGSTRFDLDNEDTALEPGPIWNIYIRKPYFMKAKRIKVTVEEVTSEKMD